MQANTLFPSAKARSDVKYEAKGDVTGFQTGLISLIAQQVSNIECDGVVALPCE